MTKDDSITRAYVITEGDDAYIRALAQRNRCSNSAALRIILRDHQEANARELVDSPAEYVTGGARGG